MIPETYRDRYAKIVGDVRSDGYALLFNRGKDDGTVPYIPTSQDRFKFGLDSKYVPVHATYADDSFEWDRIEFHLTKDAGSGLEAYVSSWPGCSARPKMLSAEKIAALGFKRKSMRVYGFAVSAEGLRAYRAAKRRGRKPTGRSVFLVRRLVRRLVRLLVRRLVRPPSGSSSGGARASSAQPKKRKNLPTPDGVFTANGRCNLCECKYGGGDKARITHENGKRHQANLAAKRRKTE